MFKDMMTAEEFSNTIIMLFPSDDRTPALSQIITQYAKENAGTFPECGFAGEQPWDTGFIHHLVGFLENMQIANSICEVLASDPEKWFRAKEIAEIDNRNRGRNFMTEVAVQKYVAWVHLLEHCGLMERKKIGEEWIQTENKEAQLKPVIGWKIKQ